MDGSCEVLFSDLSKVAYGPKVRDYFNDIWLPIMEYRGDGEARVLVP